MTMNAPRRIIHSREAGVSTGKVSNSRGRGTTPALAATAAVLSIAACGSSAKPGAAGPPASRLEFSQCMRSHGVSGFPDPSSTGAARGPNSTTIFGIVVPSTIDASAPAFRSATQDCAKAITGSAPKPAISARQRTQMIARAQCMREHGVPNFPDPTFTANGISVFFGPGVDPQSPAFVNAQRMCGSGA